ncbi:MAG: META domain-containing protein [Sphingomicrobium sp.]
MKAAVGFRVAVAAAAALCGGCTAINLAPDTLEGTSWRIAAVNGQPTPAAGDYSMRFEAGGSVAARFGCNYMGGKYRIVGDTLTISNVATTLMGCPEPAGTHESEGSAILSRPMRVSFPGSERMGVSNEAGSIALDRAR